MPVLVKSRYCSNFCGIHLNKHVTLTTVCLRMLVWKFSNTTFTSVRWWFSYVKNVKKWVVTDFILERTCPEDDPKSEKHWASLANKASVCKPKNIAIKSLKWSVLCQILFKWTYSVNVVNWWGYLQNKFKFSDHSFAHLAVARWQDSMSRGQKSWNLFELNSHAQFLFIYGQYSM